MIFQHLRSRSSRILTSSLFFVLIISIVACSGNSTEATRQVVVGEIQVTIAAPTQAAYTFKTSDPGTITVHGDLIVLNPAAMVPASEDSIYLVPMPAEDPISTIPQFEVGKVPQADVNETNGEFVFTNLQPGQYAVVVVTAGGAQIPVRKMGTSSYVIFTLDSSQVDSTVEIGTLSLP
jgi:hypothetical protein